MRAFVLSGGGNRGPLQVGALQALLEAGITPQMVVGCSTGALNAVFLAREVSLEQMARLADVWRSVSFGDIYPGSKLGAYWRFLTGKDSLFDNRKFFAFLQRNGATPAETFGQMRVRLYVTATHLKSGRLHVFGLLPGDRVLDALMASTALTPLHPPWEVDGERYVDGGTVTPLPLRVALERGATEIFSLHIVDHEASSSGERDGGLIQGVAAVVNHSVSTMLRLQAQHDLLLAEVAKKVKLHYIPLAIADAPKSTDFSQAERMIEHGHLRMLEAIAQLGAGASSPPSPEPSVLQRALAACRNLLPQADGQSVVDATPDDAVDSAPS